MEAILLPGEALRNPARKCRAAPAEESHLHTFLEEKKLPRKEFPMISRTVTLPELGLVAMTRAALGFGLGLLIAERIETPQRRAVGWTLVAVGAISTIPLAINFFGSKGPQDRARHDAKRPDDKMEMRAPETVESP